MPYDQNIHTHLIVNLSFHRDENHQVCEHPNIPEGKIVAQQLSHTTVVLKTTISGYCCTTHNSITYLYF